MANPLTFPLANRFQYLPVINYSPENRQILNSICQRKHWFDGLAMLWNMTDFCMKLLKAEWEVNQQEECKCYMIWQMMVAKLHSNGQLRTERNGDTEKGCQKPAVQQKTTDDNDSCYQMQRQSQWDAHCMCRSIMSASKFSTNDWEMNNGHLTPHLQLAKLSRILKTGRERLRVHKDWQRTYWAFSVTQKRVRIYGVCLSWMLSGETFLISKLPANLPWFK